MKRNKLFILVSVLAMAALVFTSGCNTGNDDGNGSNGGGTRAEGEFSFSDGIDENGFWIGVTATDYVDVSGFRGLVIPRDLHYVPDSVVQNEISEIRRDFPTGNQITDRAVAAGDLVNIDYVGSINGVEFEGGNSFGEGFDVLAGSREFIDDFLDQIIGAMPGDVVDVRVSFPDFYPPNPELEGQPALFVTTINYIVELYEITDAFVSEHFGILGVNTASELETFIRASHEAGMEGAVMEFVGDFLTNRTVSSIPAAITNALKNQLTEDYRMQLEQMGFELEEGLFEFMGINTVDELFELYAETIELSSTFFLSVQAVAESAGILISDEDVANYFAEHVGIADISQFVEDFGMPYLKMNVLTEKVMSYIAEHAVLG